MLSFYITFPFWTCLRFPFGFGLSLWKSGMLPLEITLMLTLCFFDFLWFRLFSVFRKSYSEVFIGITFTNFLVSMLIRFFLKIYINNEKVILFIFDHPTRQIELSEIFILLLDLCPCFPYSVLMIFLKGFFLFFQSLHPPETY